MARSKISISMKRLHIAKEISYYKEKESRLFSKNVASKKKFFLGHGKYFFDIGLFDWSEFLFSQLYLYNPYDIEYLDYLGRILLRKGYYQSAKRYFQRILEIWPGYTPAIRKIDYIDAIINGKLDRKIRDDYPAEAHISKEVSMLLGKLSRGTASIEEKKEVDRLFNREIYKGIKDEYLKITQIDPFDPDNEYFKKELKLIEELEKERQRISQLLNIKFNIDPDVAANYFDMGVECQRLGHHTKAISYYQKAIQVNPIYTGPYNNLGNIYFWQYRLKEAEAAFEKSLSINPSDEKIQRQLSAVKQKIEVWEKLPLYNRR